MRIIVVALLMVHSALMGFFQEPTPETPPNTGDMTGSEWRLLSYGAPGSMTDVMGEQPVTLTFETESEVTGNGGCNSYGGMVMIDGESITFSDVFSTEVACADSAVMEQEQAYFAALQSAWQFNEADGRLTIQYGEGQQLVYAPAGESLLRGSTWRLESYGADAMPVADGNLISLGFEGESMVAGNAGCNSYSGSYSIDGESITFSEVVSTLMACEETEVMEQEQIFLDALRTATRFEFTEDQLTIWYGEDEQLVFVPHGAYALRDTAWQLTSYGAPDAQTPVIDGTPVTLTFETGRRVAGNGGCNGYGGLYVVEGENITFNDVVSTLMACADDAQTQQESAYFEALQTANSFELTDGELIIRYGDGQQLTFTAAADM